MDGLNTFLISTGAITFISLSITCYEKYREKSVQKKLVDKILSSSDTSWRKVAKVKELFCYPLKSGKAISVKECYFSEHGITVDEEVRPVEDRMFIAFDENTKNFITARTHPKLLLVKFAFLTKNRAKFEAENMPPLEFDLPDPKSKSMSLIMWYGENVTGIDCGPQPSKWLSQYLNGSDYGVRLAMRASDRRRNLVKGAWKSHAKLYTTMRDEDSGLFSDLASYMIMSEESVNDLNKRLEKPIRPLQLRPNVVVKDCEPYAEDDWEWIKIGDTAVIRRFKLCTRCSMTRVDPDTGIPDPEYEPLKTLRTYRKLKDPAINKLENYSPMIGLYCGLYRTGKVRLDDDVYVYQDDVKPENSFFFCEYGGGKDNAMSVNSYCNKLE